MIFLITQFKESVTMKKHSFIRTMAAGLALTLALGGLSGRVSAANWGTSSVQYAGAEFESQYTYTGSDLGATWTAEATSFRLWAPNAAAARVNLYRSGVHGTRDRIDPFPMTQDVNGTWVVSIPGDWQGYYYTFQLEVDGNSVEVTDPYGRSTGINGQRSAILNLDATDPTGWNTDKGPQTTSINDAVIFKLNVNASTYLELANADLLAQLKDQGVTHVELPALYDCASPNEANGSPIGEGNDPVNFNTPEGAYSSNAKDGAVRVQEFKQMVQAIHNSGLSVVMAVDYTHVADAAEFNINQLVPGYFTRVAADGTYSNGSGQGNDTATERVMVRKYIADSLAYWAAEYHIDGFYLKNVGMMDTVTVKTILETNPNVIFYGDGSETATVLTKEGFTLATAANAAQVPGLAMFDAAEPVQNVKTVSDKMTAAAAMTTPGAVYVTGEIAADWSDYWMSLLAFRDAHPALAAANAADVSKLEAPVDAYYMAPGANGESNAIVAISNPTAEAAEVTLPEGQWTICVNGDAVGTADLGTAEGNVTVAAESVLVLTQDPASQMTTEPPTEEVTEPEKPVDDRTVKDKLIDFAKNLLPKLYPILPYLDVVAAVALMAISGTIIVLVLVMKRRK